MTTLIVRVMLLTIVSIIIRQYTIEKKLRQHIRNTKKTER